MVSTPNACAAPESGAAVQTGGADTHNFAEESRLKALVASIAARAAGPGASPVRASPHAGGQGDPPALTDTSPRPGPAGTLVDTQAEFPPGPESRPTRARLFKLRDRLRPYAHRRQARCGHTVVGDQVAVYGVEGRLAYRGVETCGSVWSCPVCSARIRSHRAEEITHAVAAHGQDRVAMLSLTVAHGLGDSLRETRRGVAKAWQRVIRGAPWIRFRDAHCVGYVRALEVTRGEVNGWHPHLHVLLFLRYTPDESDLATMRAWFAARWADAVARELGTHFRPSDAHGVSLDPCRVTQYLAKLGLELTHSAAKQARGANRSAWEIADDLGARGERADEVLWLEWQSAMKGARMLTWSKGLRARCGLAMELDDLAIASHEDPRAAPLCIVSRAAWVRARAHGPGTTAHMLSVCELGGVDALATLLERITGIRGAVKLPPPDTVVGPEAPP